MWTRFFACFLSFSLGACGAPKTTETCSSNPGGQEPAKGDACFIQADYKSISVQALSEEDEHQVAVDQREAVASQLAEAQDAGYEDSGQQEGPPVPSNEIPMSNRQGKDACKCTKPDCEGEECKYECLADDHIPVGKHVYRKAYVRTGETILQEGFFGGRCAKLCSGNYKCKPGEAKARSWEKNCFVNTCYGPVKKPSIGSGSGEDEALLDLARGNWALWQMGRSSTSGLYVDNINSEFSPKWNVGKADVTGCGLIMECIAVSMGLQSKSEAQDKVLQTLKALAGELPKVNMMMRSKVGKFFAGIMDTATGAPKMKKGASVGNTVATGLLFGGVLFAKTYFQTNFPNDPNTKKIAKYAVELWESIEWDKMVCKSGKVNPTSGDQVAWDVDQDNNCLNAAKIRAGKLQFNEAYVGRWFAYVWACKVKKTNTCSNMKNVWNAQETFKKEPQKWLNKMSTKMSKTREILSKWGSYVVQLPYYMANPFNSDKLYQQLFHESFKVEKDLYEHAPFYAPDRYGLGAGPTSKWCAGTGYIADRLGADPGCMTYSPHGTVGYLSTKDPVVKADVLKLLEDGDTVTMVEDPKTKKMHPILDRRMLLDAKWRPYGITMIDMASELFGLGAYFLGNEFFIENSDFFDNPKAPWV